MALTVCFSDTRWSGCGFLTFSQAGRGEWNADHAHQIFNGDQRPQNGSDSDGLTFTSIDQLSGNELG